MKDNLVDLTSGKNSYEEIGLTNFRYSQILENSYKLINNIKNEINKETLLSNIESQINKIKIIKDKCNYEDIEKYNSEIKIYEELYKEIKDLDYKQFKIIEKEFYNYIEKLKLENPEDLEILQREVFDLLLQKKRSDATELIVEEFYKKFKIIVSRDDKNPEFMIYKNGIYVEEGRTYIEEFTRNILGKNYSTQLLNDIINKISADNKRDFEKIRDNINPYLLATKDYLINLKTMEKKDFSKDIILFNKIPVKYDEKAECPKIRKFLTEIFESESDINLIYEVLGFSLVNDYFLEKAVMFLGNGRNGKGKLLQLMKSFYGIENTCSVRLQEMNTQSSSICDMNNKYVNLAGDLSATALKETGLFKELTGRDIIQVKRKYKNDLKFVNSATCIFACNELPKVYDKSKGFWERWVLINFPYEFIDKEDYDKLSEEKRKNKKIKNPNIIEDILNEEELSGLLNLALEGLKRVLKNKRFTYSSNAEEVRNSWVRKSDSFMAFCMDNLEEDYESKISKKDLRQKYIKYCKKHKVKSSSDISIKISLEELFGIIEGQDFQTGLRYWEGIKFKKLEKDQIDKSNYEIKKNIINIFNNSENEILEKSYIKETLELNQIIFSSKILDELEKEGIIQEVKKNKYQLI